MGTVLVGLIPAPVIYRSLQSDTTMKSPPRNKEKKVSYSFPMAIGSPLAPRSPRPRIREPGSG